MIKFESLPADGRAHASFAEFAGGFLRVTADAGAVELTRYSEDSRQSLRLTAEQARALGAEMVAAAAAVDAARGVAAQTVEG